MVVVLFLFARHIAGMWFCRSCAASAFVFFDCISVSKSCGHTASSYVVMFVFLFTRPAARVWILDKLCCSSTCLVMFVFQFTILCVFQFTVLFVSVYCSVCVSVHCSVCVSVYCSACFSVYCSVRVSVHCSVCVSLLFRVRFSSLFCVFQFTVLCMFQFMCVSVHCSVCVSVHCSVCFSLLFCVFQFICVSVHCSVCFSSCVFQFAVLHVFQFASPVAKAWILHRGKLENINLFDSKVVPSLSSSHPFQPFRGNRDEPVLYLGRSSLNSVVNKIQTHKRVKRNNNSI